MRDGDAAALTTAQLKIVFSLKRGNLTYSSSSGVTLLRTSDAFLAPTSRMM